MIGSFSQLNEIFRIGWNLYITDFLDILIIALLLYSLFIFLRKTRTTLVILGLAITLFLYLLASMFNLYLTFITLRYFVGVSVVVFVVIFQTEIKRYFEFIGVVGSRHIKVGPMLERQSPVLYDIIQASVKMAQTKIGALIVIQAKDKLEQFVDGGIALDGIISEEMLLSIFDPHSEGHDGAVIVNNNRVTSFSAHLPLSTNFKEISKHGTRHSAALGLSEVTDALCIVVSEEKGTISICKEGKLKVLNQFTDLEKELDRFVKNKFEPKKENSILGFLKYDTALKALALVFAFFLWFFTAYQAGVIEKQYIVPIIIENLPKDLMVDNYSPKEITLTVSGRGESVFSQISVENFKVAFDATNLESGTGKLPIARNDIVVPTNLALVKYEPAQFLLTSQRYYSVKIPVRAVINQDIQEDFEVKSVEVTPEEVELLVLFGTEAPSEITTDVIELPSKPESTIMSADLIIPEGVKLSNGDTFVDVAVSIDSKEAE